MKCLCGYEYSVDEGITNGEDREFFKDFIRIDGKFTIDNILDEWHSRMENVRNQR
jgi:hypothetical protein